MSCCIRGFSIHEFINVCLLLFVLAAVGNVNAWPDILLAPRAHMFGDIYPEVPLGEQQVRLARIRYELLWESMSFQGPRLEVMLALGSLW